ncbi:MAG: hypothetical protein NVSMB17_09870 [Candidatus Dormibacteria bacterium]
MSPVNHATNGFLAFQTRGMRVPAGLEPPPSWLCTVADHRASAACSVAASARRGREPRLAPSYVAGYIPVVYALPGLLARPASTPGVALLLARAGMAFAAVALLSLAVFALWLPSRPGSLTGILVAASPMVVFNSAVLSPSAVEIPAAIALVALVIRLARGRPWPGWLVAATCASAWLLAVARPLGAVLVFAAILLFASLGGVGLLRTEVRVHPRRWSAVFAIITSGCGINLAWQLLVVGLPPHAPGSPLGLLPTAIRSMPEVLGETIGVFGYLDTLMPRPAYALGGLLFVGLLGAALVRGPIGAIRRLELLLVVEGLAVLAVSVFVVLPLGVDPQGRYVLPLLVTIPILSGEMVAVAGGLARVVATAAAVGVGVLQAVAFISAAHRFAVGLGGPWWFLHSAQWVPPGGWPLWLLAAVAGSLGLGVAGVWQAGRGRGREYNPLPATL